MLRKIIFLVSILFFTYSPSFAREHSGRIILKKNLKNFSTSLELDYRRNEAIHHYRHYDLGVRIPFLRSWATSIRYRRVYEFSNNKWRLENRPYISLHKSFNSKLAEIEFRSRQAFRFMADDTYSTLNRSRISIKPNIEIFKINPFISNELFYNLDENEYIRNRTVIGLIFPKTNFGEYSIRFNNDRNLENNNRWSTDYRIVFSAVYEF